MAGPAGARHEDCDAAPLWTSIVARADPSAQVGRPAHRVVGVDEETDDGVRTGARPHWPVAAGRRTESRCELQPDLGGERDVSSDRRLEGRAFSDDRVEPGL